jgi:hypothetical protein
VRRYYYQSHDHLKQQLHTLLMAYNFAKRLKTLKGLTPYEHICKGFVTLPNRARSNSAGTSGSRRGVDFVPCLHR